MGRFSLKSQNVGIDLGTSNTIVFVAGKGIVLREPSVVAKNVQTGEILAIGSEASRMIGRTSGNIAAFRPLKEGVIADYEAAVTMMKYFLEKAIGKPLIKPNVMASIPSVVTEVEKRTVLDAIQDAGAGTAFIIEKSYAAALGAGIPVQDPLGHVVMDIGGGTVEVAAISLGGIINSRTSRHGGESMDEAIIQYVRKKYNVLIGERTAEEIKREIGCADLSAALPLESRQVHGRDIVTGQPKAVSIEALDVAEAIQGVIRTIIQSAKEVLEEAPPEISADVVEQGIVLTGGGALLKGMADVISREISVPVSVANAPLDCAALGTGEFFTQVKSFRNRGL